MYRACANSKAPSSKCVLFLFFSIQFWKRHIRNSVIILLYQIRAHKALFKVPKICNMIFWIENAPPTNWLARSPSELSWRDVNYFSVRMSRKTQLLRCQECQGIDKCSVQFVTVSLVFRLFNKINLTTNAYFLVHFLNALSVLASWSLFVRDCLQRERESIF